MFPVWHHYNLKYTTKGLIKQTLWQLIPPSCLFTLFLFIVFRSMKLEKGGMALATLPALLLHNSRQAVKTGLRYLASCFVGIAERV